MHLVTSVASAKSPDKTYYLFPVAMWTYVTLKSPPPQHLSYPSNRTHHNHSSQADRRTVTRNSIAEIASGIVCSCLITMPHFFRHMAPKIASKLSYHLYSRSTGPRSKFTPPAALVRPGGIGGGAHKVSGPYSYDSATSRGGGGGGKDDYMELGDSRAWRRGGSPPAARVLRLETTTARRRDDDEWGGRGPVSHLPSHVTSIYSDV